MGLNKDEIEYKKDWLYQRVLKRGSEKPEVSPVASASQFKKHDKIKQKTGKFICICADEEFAIFAPLVEKRDGSYTTRFTKLFAVSNVVTDAFEFERI